MYLENYKFRYKRKFVIPSQNFEEKFDYSSMLYINNFFNENEKNYYHIMELDMNAKLDGKKLGKEAIVFYVFASLIVEITPNEYLAKIYNEKNLLYRLNLIKEIVENEPKLIEKLGEYEIIIKDRNLQISNLSADLIQKEDENNKLKSRLENIEADIAQIDKLKQKADQTDALQSKLEEANADLESKEKTNQSLKQRNEELEASQRNEEALKEDNDSKRLQIVKLQTSINSKDQRISELEGEVKNKDETIENLQDKLSILENFKMKVISFISKISNLIPNFSRLLDDEPNEIKDEIKSKIAGKDSMGIGF